MGFCVVPSSMATVAVSAWSPMVASAVPFALRMRYRRINCSFATGGCCWLGMVVVRLASDFIRGDDLDDLLSKLLRSVEIAKASRGGLPEKIWMKQQFAVGVNDVTRVLERMPHSVAASHSTQRSSEAPTVSGRRQAPLVPLQAVLVAADCNPKWLTKHIPTLASTRQVPVFCVKDNKGGSLRLGHVVNVRTALAIGVKARDSMVNKTIDEVLKDSKLVANEVTSSPVTCLD